MTRSIWQAYPGHARLEAASYGGATEFATEAWNAALDEVLALELTADQRAAVEALRLRAA